MQPSPVPAYQEIVDNALGTTQAHLVVLSLFDPPTGEVRTVAWGGLHTAVIRSALEAVRRSLPDFEPTRLDMRADSNPFMARTYLEGEPTACSVADIARGVVPRVVVDRGARLVGLRCCYSHPLKLGGRVEGALTLLTADEMSEARKRVCAAFARQVALTLENGRLLDEARRARAELETVFEATQEAIVVFDRDGRVLRSNDRAREEMLALGGDLPEDAEGALRRLKTESGEPPPPIVPTALAGQASSLVLVLRDAADLTRRLHVHAAPIRGAGGQVQGAVLVTRDITELHDALMERARLDGAIKTARMVAHELNNKLNYTIGFGSLLLEAVSDPRTIRYAQAVVQGAEETAATVRSLQRLIRFEQVDTPLGAPMLDLDASTRPPSPP